MSARTRRRAGGTMDHWPTTPEERIAAFRAIVTEWDYAKIDGVMVDGFTASVVVQVYDALNDANRAKFSALSAKKMALVALKLTK